MHQRRMRGHVIATAAKKRKQPSIHVSMFVAEVVSEMLKRSLQKARENHESVPNTTTMPLSMMVCEMLRCGGFSGCRRQRKVFGILKRSSRQGHSFEKIWKLN